MSYEPATLSDRIAFILFVLGLAAVFLAVGFAAGLVLGGTPTSIHGTLISQEKPPGE